MKAEDRAQVRADLLQALNWPVTSGEVSGAAETVAPEWRADVAVAASRLPDDGHYLDIDDLWETLDPILKEVVHT